AVPVGRGPRRRARRAVAVQAHGDIAARMTRVVHGLVGEPARERTVANHAHDLVLVALQVPRRRDPERRRKPGAGVAGAEVIVLALGATQESREAARLAQRGEALV